MKRITTFLLASLALFTSGFAFGHGDYFSVIFVAAAGLACGFLLCAGMVVSTIALVMHQLSLLKKDI
jgi:hypothetical protein